MAERIVIHPVTRIEGHAKISIYVDAAGEVESAQFHVTEFRGFEKICEGRPFHEMPGLMSRVCGICPVSHVIASSKAGDGLLGVDPPPAAVLQRRLLNYAQVLQSHALSFFHLSSPDLLLGLDSPPEKRNIFGLVEREPDFIRRGIRLRQFGQRVIELAGGKRVHPVWGAPGGVLQPLPKEARDEMAGWITESIDSLQMALGRLKSLLDSLQEEIQHLGNFPSLFLGTVNPDGGLEYYDGVIRIVDSEGNIVADRLDPRRYNTFIEEASEEWTFVKFAYYKPLGYPGGKYRVGPLARLNVAQHAGTPRADREMKEFKQRSRGSVCESFHYHLARLIEMLHSVERIEELLNDPELLGEDVRARALPNRKRPLDRVRRREARCSITIRSITMAPCARQSVDCHWAKQSGHEHGRRAGRAALCTSGPTKRGMLNRVEAAIRCFDPCLSCSTHALGQMPLIIELRDKTGRVLERIERS